jgi:hypothetical protein
MVMGEGAFRSLPFSNHWSLIHKGETIAHLRRIPSRHTSEIDLPDGTRLELVPEGWGTVVALEDGEERSRIERRSWWGRSWEISGPGFGCLMTSDLMPRRWTLRIGNEPAGRLAGTILSYNRLDVQTDVAIPASALALAWHVIARPWEQAAAPGVLVARPALPE